jgi:hypothetical protein
MRVQADAQADVPLHGAQLPHQQVEDRPAAPPAQQQEHHQQQQHQHQQQEHHHQQQQQHQQCPHPYSHPHAYQQQQQVHGAGPGSPAAAPRATLRQMHHQLLSSLVEWQQSEGARAADKMAAKAPAPDQEPPPPPLHGDGSSGSADVSAVLGLVPGPAQAVPAASPAAG